MKRRDLEKILRDLGYIQSHGGSHDKWTNGAHTDYVPRHGEVAENLARAIIKRCKAAAKP